jgi:hypothetical protein
LLEKRRDKSMRSLFERALAYVEDRNQASHGTTSTVAHLPPILNSSLAKGEVVLTSNLSAACRFSMSLRPRLRACLVNALAQSARRKEGDKAIPALADQMMNTLEMRFRAVVALAEPGTTFLYFL